MTMTAAMRGEPMPECHCDTINEFHSVSGPDPMSDAGAGVYAELDALMAEDIEYHQAAGGA
jgi:hypothetical protein